MHHKYAVRDGDEVWSGSTNWTDESWSRQENVIARVTSRALAERFTRNFDELWETGIVELSGRVDPVRVDVGGTRVRAWFTPGYGDALSHRIGKRIGRAARRVRVCSPVITAAPVLAALAQVNSERNVDLAGCVDATQVADVIRQWHANGNAAWKLPLLERALADRFSAKRSTPWSQESLHDFMHAKVTVADDVVFVGSFNLSRSGEKNAENTLEIENAALADTLAAYVDEVRERYPRLEL
jgi:phosphatidylserine/phosphatidylglycerophosphate/cardiolipin synthase-like enzyme